VYRPIQLHSSVHRAIRFPSGAAEFGTVGELAAEICGLRCEWFDLPTLLACGLTAWVLTTWTFDVGCETTEMPPLIPWGCRKPSLISESRLVIQSNRAVENRLAGWHGWEQGPSRFGSTPVRLPPRLCEPHWPREGQAALPHPIQPSSQSLNGGQQ
jgi:hypothetical protein